MLVLIGVLILGTKYLLKVAGVDDNKGIINLLAQSYAVIHVTKYRIHVNLHPSIAKSIGVGMFVIEEIGDGLVCHRSLISEHILLQPTKHKNLFVKLNMNLLFSSKARMSPLSSTIFLQLAQFF